MTWFHRLILNKKKDCFLARAEKESNPFVIGLMLNIYNPCPIINGRILASTMMMAPRIVGNLDS